MARRLLVVATALMIAAQVIRDAAVDALTATSPERAARFWRGHPDVELAIGMAEIGKAAHARITPDAGTFALIDDAAMKAPLAPEPFLVHGVEDQLAGRLHLAGDAFQAAELRDPRSLPAHYFLAVYYYRSGDIRRTLAEIAVLAKLTPTGTATLAPYLAAYAKDRSTWPYLRDLFRSDANLEDASLVALAKDAANADEILALSDPARRTTNEGWVPVLISSLADAGEYDRARALWAETAGVKPTKGSLYDPDFTDSRSPPPFNWNLVSSTVGLAERQRGGRLHVIFYGHEDGVLASQLLTLSPGAYRMTLAVSGGAVADGAMRWSIRCDKKDSAFAEMPLNDVAKGSWTFTVPPNCGAQWLELSGTSSDVAQQSDLTISKLRLVPAGADG